MSPRPSTMSDEEILVRATRAVRRHGPGVTLTQIAAAVGLSSARLVQRFGSRRELLSAVEASVDARLLRSFVQGLAGYESPLEGLVESLAALAARSARRLYLLSSSYVFDPRHLSSPDGALQAQRRIEEFERGVQGVLDGAVAAAELPHCDTAALGHAVFVCWVGAYNLWAYAPVGQVGDAVRRDLTYLFTAARGDDTPPSSRAARTTSRNARFPSRRSSVKR